MRLIKTKSGFTLIEVMMVLAIASLLSIILITQYGRTQQRAQFTDAIERLITGLERAKTEANSTYSSGPSDTYTAGAGRVFFAKAVVFSDDSDEVEVRTLTADLSESGAINNVAEEDELQTTTLPWGVKCQGAECSYAVVFTRQLTDGLLNTYVVPKSSLTDSAAYSLSSSSANLQLTFISPQDLEALVTVNANSNEVKREYTN